MSPLRAVPSSGGRSLGIDLVPQNLHLRLHLLPDREHNRKDACQKRICSGERNSGRSGTFLKEEHSSIDHLSLADQENLPFILKFVRSSKSQEDDLNSSSRHHEWFLALRARGEEDLLQADIVLPSLDAVSQEIFMRINRPRSGSL